MDFYASARKHEDKLGEILGDHHLCFKFQTDQYPITLTISQSQDVGDQMEIYSNADGSVSSIDAVLRYIFKLDDIEIQTNGRLVMDLKLLSKINGVVKKWDAAYKAAFFADTRKIQAAKKDDQAETEEDDIDGNIEVGDFDDFFDEPEDADKEEQSEE